MRIQRLQTRVIVFFVALLALVQIAAFWFVNAANSRNAQTKVAEELNAGQRVFARLLDQNSEKLKLSARVLAGDFAFREAIATHDNGTIASVLANHGAREGLTLQVSVNISARDLMNRELPEHVAELLAEYEVTPGLLCLEITESGFIEDPGHAQKVLDRLAELGVKLSIDDYGTGYSFRCRSSRSISHSSHGWRPTKRSRPSCVRPSTSGTTSGCRSWPRASKTWRSGTCCDTSVATTPRATS
jgi:hypothetical protein